MTKLRPDAEKTFILSGIICNCLWQTPPFLQSHWGVDPGNPTDTITSRTTCKSAPCKTHGYRVSITSGEQILTYVLSSACCPWVQVRPDQLRSFPYHLQVLEHPVGIEPVVVLLQADILQKLCILVVWDFSSSGPTEIIPLFGIVKKRLSRIEISKRFGKERTYNMDTDIELVKALRS